MRECSNGDYQDTQGYAGGPINTRTGGYDYSIVDLSVPTTAGPLVFQRNYASLATEVYTTTLGYGWTHNHDIRLIFPGDPGGEAGVVWFKAHSANQYQFIDNGDGTYTPYPGVLASLTYDPGLSQYTLINSAQAVYTFDANGKLLTWSDPQGHTFTYTYDPEGRLTRITDPSSLRWLDFAYDPVLPERLTAVSDYTGRQVSFGYDPLTGDLITVTDVLLQTWQYRYEDANHPHHLTQALDPTGGAVERTVYDSAGRAIQQYVGLNITPTVELIYDLVYTMVITGEYTHTHTYSATAITDGLGFSSTHVFDGRNTLYKAINPLDAPTDKAYDANFRPVSLTDPLDHLTQLNWSDTGANLQGITDAAGYVTQLSYDALNNLTAVTDTLWLHQQAGRFSSDVGVWGTVDAAVMQAPGAGLRTYNRDASNDWQNINIDFGDPDSGFMGIFNVGGVIYFVTKVGNNWYRGPLQSV